MIAVLPQGSKPTKGASSDGTRPILNRGELVELGADQWVLDVTDSYKLVRIPITLKDWDGTPALVAGPVSADALKAIEKSGAFTADAETVAPWSDKAGGMCGAWGPADGAPAFARVGGACDAQFPKFDELAPSGDVVYRFGLNVALLVELVQAVGPVSKRGAGTTVVLEYRPCNLDGQVNMHGTSITVGEHAEVGLIMPIRVDAPAAPAAVTATVVAGLVGTPDASVAA